MKKNCCAIFRWRSRRRRPPSVSAGFTWRRSSKSRGTSRFRCSPDGHGNVIHLGERECSIQTGKHQKLLEESPCVGLGRRLRNAMGEAAIRAAKAVGYVNAGTVEFMVDGTGKFYFLEMNTRIQVEHPVTEMVTGLDLVKEQIRIAYGHKLGKSERDIEWRGHAIECRITAEDPYNKFLASSGTVHSLHLPGGPGVRVDTHLYPGYVVPPYLRRAAGEADRVGADTGRSDCAGLARGERVRDHRVSRPPSRCIATFWRTRTSAGGRSRPASCAAEWVWDERPRPGKATRRPRAGPARGLPDRRGRRGARRRSHGGGRGDHGERRNARFRAGLVMGFAEHRLRLDEVIAKYARGWTLSRMANVDRNILRLAVYELLFCPEVPAGVVVDEAVELAKKYSTGESGRFVNGILGQLARHLDEERGTAPEA